MPIFLECDRCTACCRWPGQVRLSESEITQISSFLKISEHEFLQNFTRISAQRTGLALQDKANGECIFLDGGDCRVNPVKPQQCRDFPNLWNFPGFEALCRARRVEVTREEFNRRVACATKRPLDQIRLTTGSV